MANIRAYNAVRSNASNGAGYFYIHVDMEETGYNIANNTSTITITCRILGRGYSRDEFTGGGAWSGGPTKKLSLQWYDEISGGPVQKSSGSWTKGGKTSSGTDNGCPTLTSTFTVPHKEDGSLKGYARVVLSGTNSDYAPNNTSVQTVLTSLTNIPRASVATLDNDFHVSYGNDSDTRTVSLLKYVESYYDELAITFSGVNHSNVELVNYGEIEDGDSITLDTTALNILYLNSNEDILLDDGDGHKYYELELVVSTYQDNTKEVLVGTKKTTVKIFITGLEPTFTSVDFTSSTSGIAGNNIVKDNSNIHLKYVINTKAYAHYGLDTTIGTFDVSSLTVYSDGIGIDLEKTSVTNYDLHYVDSRGLVLDVTNRKTLIEYNKLTAIGSSKRHQPTDDKIEIIINGLFWNENFGISNNNLTIKYKLWKLNETEPTNWTGTICNAITSSTSDVTIQDGRYSCDFVTDALYDYKSIYKLKVQVNDLVTTLTPEKIISRGIPVFYWTAKDVHIGEVGDNSKLYLNGEELGKVEVDTSMSDTSENAVQNKIIKEYIDQFGFEVGSNSNGNYIKFNNGLLICYVSKQFNTGNQTSSITTSGNTYYAQNTWNFPYPFIEVPVVSSSCLDRATGLYGCCMENPTTTSVIFFCFGPASGRGTGYHAIAIGKWK